MGTLFGIKGPQWGPQTGNPKNLVGTKSEYNDSGRYVPMMFLSYSWGYIFRGPLEALRVSCQHQRGTGGVPLS